MKQLKASMPDELAVALERASAKSGRSLSAEIAARIEQTFAQEAAGQSTSDFIQSVTAMAAEVARECGSSWDSNTGSYAVLTLAIEMWLGERKPKGVAAFGNRPHA